MLLRAYGYSVDKTMVADTLEDAFIGDPYSIYSYGAFPKVMECTTQQLIDDMGGSHEVRALYGLSEDELLQKVEEGKPICVWTSMHNKEIEWKSGWYLLKEDEYTDEYFEWPANEHVVVLVSCNKEEVIVCDPLVGKCHYLREAFFRHYK